MVGGFIHVVDDDEHVRFVTASVLEEAGYDVLAHESGDAFLARADLSVPACVVLDLRMPGMSGEDVLGRLAKHARSLSVVVVSGHVDIPRAVAVMRGGAVSVIQKPWQPSDLLAAVEQGLAALPPTATIQRVTGPLDRLTPRERDVIGALATHGTNRRVADALGLSVRTVEWYRASAMKRLGVSNSVEMLNLYFEANGHPTTAEDPAPHEARKAAEPLPSA